MDALQLNGSSLGRQTKLMTSANSGRYVKAVQPQAKERHFDIAVDATLRASLRRRRPNAQKSPITVLPEDLRKKKYSRPKKRLIVFVVDGSDSMGQGTFVRMKSAKGAVLALLSKARLRRHRVAMVTFRDDSAQAVLSPTTSLALAQRQLASLPTGGATPFAHGLIKAWQMIKTERVKDPSIEPLMVIISDGEANVPYEDRSGQTDVMAELLYIAQRIGQDRIQTVVIDTMPSSQASRHMRRLAGSLGGAYYHIDRLRAGKVMDAIAAQSG